MKRWSYVVGLHWTPIIALCGMPASRFEPCREARQHGNRRQRLVGVGSGVHPLGVSLASFGR
jgi:hypothetical protein